MFTLIGGAVAISAGCSSAHQAEPAANSQKAPLREIDQPTEIIIDNSDQIAIIEAKGVKLNNCGYSCGN